VKRNFHLFRWLLAGVLLGSLAGQAWAVALAPQNSPLQPTEPNYDVVVENCKLRKNADSTRDSTYVFLAPGRHGYIPAKGYTLVICLHGTGDTADNFAKFWMALVNSRPDVVVAAVEVSGVIGGGYTSRADLISAVIDDAVANKHVNPRHVILAGYSGGASDASVAARERPELLAGFAYFSQGFLSDEITGSWKENAGKMAVYFSAGTEEMNDKLFAFEAARLKNIGFANLFTDHREGGHQMSIDQFGQMTMRMMEFFAQAFSENDQKEKRTAMMTQNPAPAPVDESDRKVVAEKRTVQKKGLGSYIFLSQDRSRFHTTQPSTLLICLPGQGDSATDFAKNWIALVNSRADVLVAVPEKVTPNPIQMVAHYQNIAQLVAAIIEDTVVRDNVDPKHVILMGYSEGAWDAGLVLTAHPDLFAGFAGIATCFPSVDGKSPSRFFNPTVKKAAERLAVYYAVGARDEIFKGYYSDSVAGLKNYRFANFTSEKPDCGHNLTQLEIAHMMTFFDKALATNDQKEQKATAGE